MRIPGTRITLDPFVLAMLGTVVLAGVWPQLGSRGGLLPMDAITQAGIALLFFLHGAKLSRTALRSGAANWRLHLLTQGCTFVLFPAIGSGVFHLTQGALPLEARLGFFFLCAVSSTISTSIAMVAIAGGSVGAAIFNATLSGLIGLVVTPLLVAQVTLTADGQLPLLDAVIDISLLLLLPFVAGHLSPRLLRERVQAHKSSVARFDRAVILLIVLASFSNSFAEGMWSRYEPGTLLLLVAMTGALLVVVLFLTTMAARASGFSREDEIVAIFCGSKKSLANGAPIALVLFGSSPMLSMILLPLMIYHQIQLIVGLWLAKRMADHDSGAGKEEGVPEVHPAKNTR